MDNNILATLKNIEAQTARLNKVAFVFQPWIEFNNLGVDGFRIPAVQHSFIPRLQLIPLVSISANHIESRKSLTTNKYVPLPVAYQRPIHASFIDLQQRYGSYGLVLVEPLSCSLNEAIRTSELFDKMMAPFKEKGLLEDLPEFFGVESPVKDMFSNHVSRVKTTAERKLASMLTHMEMDEDEYAKFIESIPILADSAVKCHRRALSPASGILPQSIEEINDRKKPKFDEVDAFLRRQFPGYNSDSSVSRTNQNDGIMQLVNILTTMAAGGNLTQSNVKEVVQREAPSLADMLPIQAGESDAETGIDLEASSDSLKAFNPNKCAAIANSGSQCKQAPDQEAEYPLYCKVHQNRAKELTEAARAAAV